MSNHRSLFGIILILTAGCFSQGKSSDSTVDLFDPRDYGTFESDEDSGDTGKEDTWVPSARVEDASNYPWLPQDRPIRFHTLEESEETRDRWEPLIDARSDPDGPLIESSLTLDYNYRCDQNLEHLVPVAAHSPSESENSCDYVDVFYVRGRFVGVGYPFPDEYLHFFEMGGTYVMEDYLVTVGWAGIMIWFFKHPDTPADPDELHDRWEIELAPRFWEWFLRLRESRVVVSTYSDDDTVTVDLYFYFEPDQMHAHTHRNAGYLNPRRAPPEDGLYALPSVGTFVSNIPYRSRRSPRR